MSQSDLLRATEKLIEVHRGWCNFCKGNVDWCRNAPTGGCTVPAVESALAHLAQPEAAEAVAWMWRCPKYAADGEWRVSIKRQADSGIDGKPRTETYEDYPLAAPVAAQPDALAENKGASK